MYWLKNQASSVVGMKNIDLYRINHGHKQQTILKRAVFGGQCVPLSSGSSTNATRDMPSGMASTIVTVSAGLLALEVTPTSMRYSRILPARCSWLGDTSFFTHTSTMDCSDKHVKQRRRRASFRRDYCGRLCGDETIHMEGM